MKGMKLRVPVRARWWCGEQEAALLTRQMKVKCVSWQRQWADEPLLQERQQDAWKQLQ